MAQQSTLENVATTKRDSLVGLRTRGNLPSKGGYSVTNPYYDPANGTHPDILSDGDKLGKSNGTSLGVAVANPNAFSISKSGIVSQTMNYSVMDTRDSASQTIGGIDDVNERTRELIKNKYNSDINQYDQNVIDTANIPLYV